MTIHHDKLAYGKLEKTSEEMSEEQILNMLLKLNEEEADGGKEGAEDNTEKGVKRK